MSLQLTLAGAGSLLAGAVAGYILAPRMVVGNARAAEGGPVEVHAENAPFSMAAFQAATGMERHRMLARVLPGTELAMVKEIAQEFRSRRPVPHEAAIRALLARWCRLAPAEALAWAREWPGTGEGAAACPVNDAALEQWTKVDPHGAMQAARRGDEGEGGAVLKMLAAFPPKEAFELHLAWQSSGLAADASFPGSLSRVIQAWASDDPQAALARLRALSWTREDGWSALAQGWAMNDPAGCADWIFSPENNSRRRELLGGIQEAAREHPEQIAAVLTGRPMDRNMRAVAETVATALAAKDPAQLRRGCANVFRKVPCGRRRWSVAGVVVKKDARTAAAMMDEMGWKDHPAGHADSRRTVLPGEGGAADCESVYAGSDSFEIYTALPDAIAEVLGSVARKDPALAARCFEKAAAANPSMNLLSSVAPVWFQQDPAAAMNWLATLTPERAPAGKLASLVNHLELDAAQAADWARRLPASPMQQALAAASVRDFKNDPAAVMERIDFPDPATRSAAVAEIARQWGRTAPQKALEHVLAEPHPMPETCQEVLSTWTQHDPTAASAWVEALPPGANRDGAIRGMIGSLTAPTGEPDYPAALTWAMQLTDSAARENQARLILERWPHNDLEAADLRTVLTTTGSALPETERQRLLQRLEP